MSILKNLIFFALLSGSTLASAHVVAPYPGYAFAPGFTPYPGHAFAPGFTPYPGHAFVPGFTPYPGHAFAPGFTPYPPPPSFYAPAPEPSFNFYWAIYNSYHQQGPIYPLPAVNACLPGHSSICQTPSGQFCSNEFMVNHQPQWLSSCVTIGFIYICSSHFAPPQPVAQTACYAQNSPCSCTINFNNQWVYEQGWISL